MIRHTLIKNGGFDGKQTFLRPSIYSKNEIGGIDDLYNAKEVDRKIDELQYEIDILKMKLDTSDCLSENLYKATKYYESEIKKITECLVLENMKIPSFTLRRLKALAESVI